VANISVDIPPLTLVACQRGICRRNVGDRSSCQAQMADNSCSALSDSGTTFRGNVQVRCHFRCKGLIPLKFLLNRSMLRAVRMRVKSASLLFPFARARADFPRRIKFSRGEIMNAKSVLSHSNALHARDAFIIFHRFLNRAHASLLYIAMHAINCFTRCINFDKFCRSCRSKRKFYLFSSLSLSLSLSFSGILFSIEAS